VPVRATLSGEWGALLGILTLPVTVPATVGEKRAVKAIELFGVTLAGIVGPVMVNPVPVIVGCDTDRLEFPVFLTVNV
jgi:hypothetical protein